MKLKGKQGDDKHIHTRERERERDSKQWSGREGFNSQVMTNREL